MKKLVVFIGLFFVLGIILSFQDVSADPAKRGKPSQSGPFITVAGGGYLGNGTKCGIGAISNPWEIHGHVHCVSYLSNGKASTVLQDVIDCQVLEITEVNCGDRVATLICDNDIEVDITAGDHFDPFSNGTMSIWDASIEDYIFQNVPLTHGFMSVRCSAR